MRQVREKELRYLKKWESLRQKKWLFVLKEGLIFGITVAVLSYLWQINFEFLQFVWEEALIRLLVFCLGSLAMAYWRFHSQEKRYQKVLKERDVSL
jgi:hypothetical protein